MDENKEIKLTTEEQSKKEPNQILELFKGIGTIFLFFFIAAIGSILFGNFYESENKAIAGLSQLATYILMLIILGIIYHKRLINDFKTFKKDNVNIAIRNWMMGLVIMIASNIIISMFLHNIAANEAANRELLAANPITNIITMVLVGPLIEEITFRASFKKAFKKWYLFAAVTGLLFGLAHISEFRLSELLFIIPYGSLGFFFAKAFYETDNIYTSYIAHVIHNAICILIIFLF